MQTDTNTPAEETETMPRKAMHRAVCRCRRCRRDRALLAMGVATNPMATAAATAPMLAAVALTETEEEATNG